MKLWEPWNTPLLNRVKISILYFCHAIIYKPHFLLQCLPIQAVKNVGRCTHILILSVTQWSPYSSMLTHIWIKTILTTHFLSGRTRFYDIPLCRCIVVCILIRRKLWILKNHSCSSHRLPHVLLTVLLVSVAEAVCGSFDSLLSCCHYACMHSLSAIINEKINHWESAQLQFPRSTLILRLVPELKQFFTKRARQL